MIIDAKDAILGRMGSYAAKQLLLGNKVDVVNCEEAIISGRKSSTLEEYLRKLHRGAPGKGPFFYKRPDFFVKRTIRGMLPFKRARGRDVFRNIKCHIGTPENLKGEKAVKIDKGDALHSADYIKVKEVCMAVGWKQWSGASNSK